MDQYFIALGIVQNKNLKKPKQNSPSLKDLTKTTKYWACLKPI